MRTSDDLLEYLAVVSTKAATLKKAAPHGDVASLEQLAGDMGAACAMMARWANDLIDLASIETEGITLQRRVRDPVELINRAVQAFTSSAAAKGVTLSVELPPRCPRVVCDQDRLMQVLHDLLDIALSSPESPTKVAVGLTAEQRGLVTIYIDVNGPGDAGFAGGLYTTERIVEAHGGTLRVESEAGRGPRFLITVPTAV